MEDVLDRYEEPDNLTRPHVCFDERPCQLLGNGRAPLPMVVGHRARVDDEYTRHGPCNVLIMVEPFQGWRHLSVIWHRTKREFAHCMAELVDVLFPDAEKIRVVFNLNTHTPAALYEVFPPAEARRILRKLEWHLPPVHGSWLNMAEIKLAVLARQCLNRRLPDATTMTLEVADWEARRNCHRATIDWRFKTERNRDNWRGVRQE